MRSTMQYQAACAGVQQSIMAFFNINTFRGIEVFISRWSRGWSGQSSMASAQCTDAVRSSSRIRETCDYVEVVRRISFTRTLDA